MTIDKIPKHYRACSLPKWAQEEIAGLARQVANLEQALKYQQQDTPSRIHWGRFSSRVWGYIPDSQTVEFQLLDDTISKVRVKLEKDGLYVSGDQRLVIECGASNCFTIRGAR